MAKKDLGHVEHSELGELEYGGTWTVFGPCPKDSAVPSGTDLARTPAKLTIAGKALRRAEATPAKGRLDIATAVGQIGLGHAAYVFIPVTAPKAGSYTLGLGADWWFQAWMDGEPIAQTSAAGNGPWPPSADDWRVPVNLDAGEHTLTVRVASGSGGFVLVAGAPTKSDAEAYEESRRKNVGISDAVLRPIKVVFLGAGSGFLQSLAADVFGIPGADRGELALVDIDEERLHLADQLCRKIADRLGRKWKIVSTPDRRKVLRGADYIINCIEVSGVDCVAHDNDIPLKYGVDQCIGDTTGPGGLFKALRTVPVFLEVLKDIERFCPDAWVLNYTNPMSILCLAAARASSAKVVGLCHSVQGASHALASWTQTPYHELQWQCAGVNHLAWFTELTHRGKDLYPALKERVAHDPKFAENDLVRFDLMQHFGYYCTESSGHDSEYLPYYRKNADVLKRYCRDGYRGGSRFYASNWPAWRVACDQRRRDAIEGHASIKLGRSWEYASYIIQAMETNDAFVIHGNVPNRGLITNLPQDGVVEVACLVDRKGVKGTHYGALPPACAALCDWNMRFFDVAASACIEKSIPLAAQALMLDPLTAAVSCPADIRRMTYELYEVEKSFLPGFKV
jgi:alpha-galactosidase